MNMMKRGDIPCMLAEFFLAFTKLKELALSGAGIGGKRLANSYTGGSLFNTNDVKRLSERKVIYVRYTMFDLFMSLQSTIWNVVDLG
jgi:hypothetical protein